MIGLIFAADIYYGNQTMISQIWAMNWTWGSKLLMISANLILVGSDWMMFLYPAADGLHFTPQFLQQSAFHPFHMIPPAWSLPLELMFYCLAPFLVRSRWRLILLAIVSLYLRHLVFTKIGANDPWNYRFFPTELVFFCMGSLSYHIYTKVKDLPGTPAIGYAAWLFVLYYMFNFPTMRVLVSDREVLPGQLIQYHSLMFILLPFIFAATKRISFDRWIGELSYPVYLLHLPILIRMAHWPVLTSVQVYNVMAYAIVIAAVINVVFQENIEKFFKRQSVKSANNEMVRLDGAKRMQAM